MSLHDVRANDDGSPLSKTQRIALDNWGDFVRDSAPERWRNRMLNLWAEHILERDLDINSAFFWYVVALTTEEERTVYLARRRLGI